MVLYCQMMGRWQKSQLWGPAVLTLATRLQVFLFWSPLELCCVVLMISLELGAAPAFAGIAALLALIPVQVPKTYSEPQPSFQSIAPAPQQPLPLLP
jgi:hypothetical protein